MDVWLSMDCKETVFRAHLLKIKFLLEAETTSELNFLAQFDVFPHLDKGHEVVLGDGGAGEAERLEGAQAEDVAGRLYVHDLERDLLQRK